MAGEESSLLCGTSSPCLARCLTACSMVFRKKWLVTTYNKERKAPIPPLVPRTCTFLVSACESSVVLCLVVAVW